MRPFECQGGLGIFGGQAVARQVDFHGQRDVRQPESGGLDLVSRGGIQFAALETRLDGRLGEDLLGVEVRAEHAPRQIRLVVEPRRQLHDEDDVAALGIGDRVGAAEAQARALRGCATRVRRVGGAETAPEATPERTRSSSRCGQWARRRRPFRPAARFPWDWA